MVNQESIPQDGFQELLKTQIHTDIPSHIEMSIMRKVEKVATQTSTPFHISAIFIFGILSFLYVLVAVVSSYFYPNIKELADFKLLIGLGIIIYIMYEANEVLPGILNQWMGKKIA